MDHNSEKSPGDLRWLFVTQIFVKNQQLILVWKTRQKKIYKNNIHKILRNFYILTDHLILARWSDFMAEN